MEQIKAFLVSNRMKSLYWRSGGLLVVGTLAAVTDWLPTLGLQASVTVFVGLVINELTKAANNYLSDK